MTRLKEALIVLRELGMPRAQQNERSALTLLALLDLKPHQHWSDASAPLIGITPVMDWARQHYGKKYQPNTRETFRRQTMHQFVAAGLALYNPDDPGRPVNSPHAVYQISGAALALLKLHGTSRYEKELRKFLSESPGLAERYARVRKMKLVQIEMDGGFSLSLSSGKHSELIKSVIFEFAPRFLPGSALIYVGDTAGKSSFVATKHFTALGIRFDVHGKMPDVVFYDRKKKWLVLVEAVTSHGPVDSKRHDELLRLFGKSKCGLVYVTAFPSRSVMTRYLPSIAWETEVWVADAPSHLIHFNGDRFLGPHGKI